MKKSARGFTLVELLVVITIIAILAVVGITAFSGAQKTARDGRRRADIDSIAKAMESKYDPVTGKYQAIADGFFASNKKPIDPTGGDYDVTLVTLTGGTADAGFWTCATFESSTPNGNASAKGNGTKYPTYSVASSNLYYCKSSQQSK